MNNHKERKKRLAPSKDCHSRRRSRKCDRRKDCHLRRRLRKCRRKPPTPPLIEERGLLTEFTADQPATQGETVSITIPGRPPGDPLPPPLTIARVRLNMDDISDRFFLTGTVGWQAIEGVPGVRFSIFRTRLDTGSEEEIFSIIDSAEADGGDSFAATSFTFVDEQPIVSRGEQLIEYTLRVVLLTPSTVTNAQVIGPIILTAAEMEANKPRSC
ncbi:hypothetical protein [Lihuaxuella thermophila]|uniref:Exosporium protein C n=1 Tax=Lihuaxuella thermophila TaxID=1173111 RepID=A0A1H8AP11_9BACL|nr:hypothetical protein [Lihuaxuella thermophila]SEM72480.1 hypothetical protein SAMN05444955_101273 [Lihuaxuella thermophila]